MRELASDGEAVFAPTIIDAEFANALRGLVNRRRISPDEADLAWETFGSLPISTSWERAWAARAIAIARECGLGKIYDAIYLACAEDYDVPLVTADQSFVRSLTPGLRRHVVLLAP